jgi:hypothetical protein
METMQVIEEQIRHKMGYILSHLDRDPISRTVGCFDRLYWGWKLKDFPDATLERLIYPLTSYYYNTKGKLYNESFLMDWICQSIEFISSIQHPDGSFDQTFPNEHSHGATAFLLFDLARTYQLIGEKCKTAARELLKQIMIKMGDYLLAYEESHGFISNHLSGAAAGLLVLYKITQDEKYKNHADFYIKKVLSRQSPAGWYVEYGGADPGYQTLAIYYLAHCFLENKDEAILKSLIQAVDFTSYFIHPDGSCGSEYGSRNTEIFYPGGFAILQERIPLAGAVLGFMADSMAKGSTVNLDTIDAGNLAPLLNNYLDMIKYEKKKSDSGCENIPFTRKPFIRDFKDAGIVVFNGENNYAVIGVSKGGVIKEFDKKKGKMTLDDCGYIGKIRGGKTISTQNLSRNEYSLDERQLEMHVFFYEISQPLPGPWKYLLLRSFNLTFGRVRWLREKIKKSLAEVLLAHSKKTAYRLVRKITFSCPLKIDDSLEPGADKEEFEYLHHGIKFSTIHMASSKYFYQQ